MMQGITLPNGKVVYVQDKPNTGYKQLEKTHEITTSGIFYKDSRRIDKTYILFRRSITDKNKNLVMQENRRYVAILDGDYSSNDSRKHSVC